MSRLGLGLVIDSARPAGVLVSGAGEILAQRLLDEPAADPVETVRELVTAVLASADGRPDRVVVATEIPLAPLTPPVGSLSAAPALPVRVGVLRIGAPATTSVPPLTGWPEALAEAVRGPVATVQGGHRYDGRELVALDVEGVRAFGVACRGVVGAVAVAGPDAHMNAAHEQRARGLLGEILADIPIVAGHDVGGAGLLERENTAVLGASVAPATQLFTDAVASVVAEARLDADLYLVTGDGTVLPATRAVRHPLALLGAAHAATRTGAARLSGSDTLVVVETAGEQVRVSALLRGVAAQTGLFSELAGIRTSMPEPRVLLRPAAGGRWLIDEERRVRAQTRDAQVVTVAVGPAGGIPGARTLPDGELAAAVGAALGEASGTIDRVYFYGEGGLRECVREARRAARELAVRRGADPGKLRVGEVREAPMTYVPVPCVRLRVTATGPLAATGAPTDIPLADRPR